MQKIILIFLFFLFCNAKELSFFEAWNEVLKNSDALKAKEESLAMQESYQNAAKDLYLPNISLEAKYIHLDEAIDIKKELFDGDSLNHIAEGITKSTAQAMYEKAIKNGSNANEAKMAAATTANSVINSFYKISNIEISKQDSFSSSIRAVWAIFTGGKIQAAQISAKANVQETLAKFDLEKLEEFNVLSKVYFGLVLANEVFKTKKQAEFVFQEHYENALKMENQGQLAKIETMTALASLDKAKVDSLKAKRDCQIMQAALKKMLHTDLNITPSTQLFTNTKIEPMEYFMEKTLASYPIFDLLNAKKISTEALVKSEKSSYFPNVFIFGDYNLYKDDSLNSKMKPDWLVGLGLKYELFSTNGRSGKLNAAYKAKMQVYHLLNQAKRDLSFLLEKTYKEANQALEEYNGLSSSVELGQESLKLRQKSFAQGMSTSLDVIDAELFLQGVLTQRLAASYNYIISLTKLLSLSNEIEKLNFYERKE